MKRIFPILFISLIVLCGFRWTGDLTLYPVDTKTTKMFFEAEFNGEKKVNLINAQQSMIAFLIAREIQGTKSIITTDIDESLVTPDMGMQGHEVGDNVQELVGNLNSWTETAICLIKAALEEKSFIITPHTDKSLQVAITPKIDMIPYPGLSRCIVFLKVTTGDGYSQEYEGDNISYDNLENIFGGAVKLAVEGLLNDDTVLAYLGAPKKCDSLASKSSRGPLQHKQNGDRRKAWSVSEVAQAFGVPEPSVRRWIIDGELIATKLGSTWLIPNSEVQRISNPEERAPQKGEVPSKDKKSYEEHPKEWLRKLRHLKTIGLLSQEQYVEEEEKLRDAGLI